MERTTNYEASHFNTIILIDKTSWSDREKWPNGLINVILNIFVLVKIKSALSFMCKKILFEDLQAKFKITFKTINILMLHKGPWTGIDSTDFLLCTKFDWLEIEL
jgi:hypothetical protein